MIRSSLLISQRLNSWQIDELGNWCHQSLVGAQQKYPAQQGTALWAGARCKWPPTSIVKLKELQRRDLLDPIPAKNHFLWGCGKGWVLNWQNMQAKQWSTKLNWASKQQIWWPKQWSIQGSDLQRWTEQTTSIIATRAQMQANGKASHCGHPSDHRDRCTHSLQINLAWITVSHINNRSDQAVQVMTYSSYNAQYQGVVREEKSNLLSNSCRLPLCLWNGETKIEKVIAL